MSLLFRHLRIHQVFGANTDVGKTILTTALVRASALAHDAFYLKPVSTGPLEDADDRHIMRYAQKVGKKIETECLFRYNEPVSPHLAVKMGGNLTAPSDQTIVNSIADYIRRTAAGSTQRPAHLYVETAGGVHSPTLSGTTQADAYRPLFLPTILIGDSKLGGISTTISAYEALTLRGYIIDALLLFQDPYYKNSEYLKEYFAKRGVKTADVEAPPPLLDGLENEMETRKYYEKIVPETKEGVIYDTVNYLDECHSRRLEELASMPERTMKNVWWPFVQHGLVKNEKDINIIDSAYGDFFSVYKGHSTTTSHPDSSDSSLLMPQFDASASWWTQTFGHAYAPLTLAAARGAGRYGHVMFPQASHLPALKLSEKMVHEGPGQGWASRAFISDNGSTGMEVGIKMALRAFSRKTGIQIRDKEGQKRTLGVLGLKGSYHGDTIGAMDACEEAGVYTCEWHDAKGYWFEPPTIAVKDGGVVIQVPESFRLNPAHTGEAKGEMACALDWVYDVEGRLSSGLAKGYRGYIQNTLRSLEAAKRQANGENGTTLAALVLEPLLMGAGGMLFVDPLFQRVLIDVVREGGEAFGLGPQAVSKGEWSGLPLIFDEVFVGLYRIGMASTSDLLGVFPDISVHAKVLTGGLVPLAVTLTSEDVFKAFLGEGKGEALLHGHSYSAHAVGCEVALETLGALEKVKHQEGGSWMEATKRWSSAVSGNALKNRIWSFWDPSFVESLSRLDGVSEVMTLGCVLAIKVQGDAAGYVSHTAQERFAPLKRDRSENGKAEGAVVQQYRLSAAPGGGEFDVHYRTLGDVGYFITSLNTPSDVIRSMEDRIWRVLSS